MKFSVYPVKPDDLFELEKKGCYSSGEIGCAHDIIKISYLNEDSLVGGFGIDGELYGIAGLYRQWRGAAQAWAIFDKRVDKNPIALSKVCTSMLRYGVSRQKLHRVSLTVKSSYNKGNEFAEHLGFVFEGKMMAYLPDGEDANLFARLF